MNVLKKVLMFIIIMILMIEIPKNNIIANSSVVPKDPIKVAVFLHNYNHYFSLLKENLENIQKENEDKVKFTFFDGKDSQNIQNESIDKALTEDFDAFIVNLHTINLNEVGSTLSKIIKKNMPLILLGEPDEKLINFVGNNGVFIANSEKDAGTMQGKILVDEWMANKKNIDKNKNDELDYIILKGKIGNPAVEERSKNVISTLENAGIKTRQLASVNSEWNKELAKKAIESLLLIYGNKIEAIIANNDEMAIGAVEGLQTYGYNSGGKSINIPVVGIDGTEHAEDLIEKGFMTGTVFQDLRSNAESIYKIMMNLVYRKPVLKDTNCSFDGTSKVIRLPYKEYIKK